MKLMSKDQTTLSKNSENCLVTEYEIGDPDIDFAKVETSGRYPATGRVKNMLSKEIVYIVEGTGAVHVEGAKHPLKAGDVVLIEAGENFFWDGHMTLFISCHPAFTPEQHQKVA